jgi:hypothetical protein
MFAHIGEIDRPTTDAIARCAIQVAKQDSPSDEAVIDCVPADQRKAARALLDEAYRFRTPSDAIEQLETAADEQGNLAPGEQLLATEPVRGNELALRLCGSPPIKAEPLESYVRASLWRMSCRNGMDQMFRNDNRAAELIAVCVGSISGVPAPHDPPSAEALGECLPADVHSWIQPYLEHTRWWANADPTIVAEVTAAFEAERREP